jgi:hypothetical protein
MAIMQTNLELTNSKPLKESKFILQVAKKHTIRGSVPLLNKGWCYQANALRLYSSTHCAIFGSFCG